ncbi:MAG: RnfABCDGE type electron transport complex subunit D [Zoogloeaceae bacterium]|jgi:electron transport complex protein RnfD|nr:RnfABCDGE type electron transport complex subunit D [Zoogloeaceae bacterium]
MNNSPYVRLPVSVRAIMLKVLTALVPGILTYVWFFGAAVLVQIALAAVTALAGEALMLGLRGKPIGVFLTDGSALVTACLIGLTFPPLAPWWLTVSMTLFAIVIVKHLYGGLGQNPFNPAMAAFAVAILAFPALMSQWPAVDVPDAPDATGFAAQMRVVFQSQPPQDGLTMATPLDTLRTQLHTAQTHATVDNVAGTHAAFGQIGGKGWEWIALAYLLGGLWLLREGVISWHMPTAFLAALALAAGAASLASPDNYAGPLFHLASGGAMLGAFFILTDPVSSPVTPRGKLIFAAGAGLLVWIIRTFGAYPDAVAFATLLMNLCVPLIDMHSQPPVFGRKNGNDKR